jgi:hypothetical protein
MVSEWSGRDWRYQHPDLGVWTGQRVLLMSTAGASVAIVGAPTACADGVKDTWRELAGWFAEQLHARYGDQVRVTYFDLFDPACPPLPPDGQLPLVTIDGETVISGGKLAMPVIRQRLETLGVKPMTRK